MIPERTRRARELRRQMTGVECMVWDQLRGRKVCGLKFRRQYSIGPYVVDFACLAARLIVEVDGPTHDFTTDSDARRERWLESRGYRVLRFTADEILQDPETVALTIEAESGSSPYAMGTGGDSPPL
jgi:very-short-patch-repair endonuclease